jgi:hypothetical protein
MSGYSVREYRKPEKSMIMHKTKELAVIFIRYVIDSVWGHEKVMLNTVTAKCADSEAAKMVPHRKALVKKRKGKISIHNGHEEYKSEPRIAHEYEFPITRNAINADLTYPVARSPKVVNHVRLCYCTKDIYRKHKYEGKEEMSEAGLSCVRRELEIADVGRDVHIVGGKLR